jgi:sugar diacid utilization regulator
MLGADPNLPVTVVTAVVDDADYPARAVLGAVTGMLADGDHLLIGSDRGSPAGSGAEVVLLVNGADPTADSLVRQLDRPADGQRALLGARRLRIGISDPTTSVGQLHSALLVARARMRAITGSAPIRWSTGANAPSHDALLALLSDRVRQAFAQSMLSPLVDYDARHGSDLVRTLRAFLDSGCAWQQAASDLHVHVNTLRYRIGRIEALTARDLSSMRDRVDFFLALECQSPTDPDA